MLRTRTSLGGMVTAPHHLAAQAGRDVLRDGGNAVEAMIAAAATIAAGRGRRTKADGWAQPLGLLNQFCEAEVSRA